MKKILFVLPDLEFGGAQRNTINIVNKLVLTRVDCDINGDVFYPSIDLNKWRMISNESFKQDKENEYDFSVETYLKN